MPFPGSSAVLRTESWASNDAPDNPGTIPAVESLPSIRDDLISLRGSPILCLTAARIIRNNSKQNTNDWKCWKQHEGNDGTQSADSWSRTSVLAPLGIHNQEQLSLADKITWSQSPFNDGNEIESDQDPRGQKMPGNSSEQIGPGINTPVSIPSEMRRKIETLGCLTKIFIK